MKSFLLQSCLWTCVSVFCITSCKSGPLKIQRSLSKEVTVETLTLTETHLLAAREYVGVVEESNNVLLSFPVPVRVTKVYVSEGQFVKKGQLLAETDTVTLHNMHETSLATLRQAQDGYDRLSQLYQSNSIPEVQFVDIQTKLTQAKAAERIAANALKESKLFAPQDGVIGKKMMEVGLNVLPDQPVLSLMNTHALMVKVSIPENEIFDTRIGQQARIEIGALHGAQASGRIIEKGVKAQAISHSYDIKIALSAAPQGLLPGMVCKAYVENLPDQSVLVVPNKAVFPMDMGKGYFVWTLDTDNIVHKRTVRVGDFAPNGITILEGLQVGDQVIVSGYQKVSDNLKVNVVNE